MRQRTVHRAVAVFSLDGLTRSAAVAWLLSAGLACAQSVGVQFSPAPATEAARPLRVEQLDCSRYATPGQRDWCTQYNAARVACSDKATWREVGRCIHALTAPPPLPECEMLGLTGEQLLRCQASRTALTTQLSPCAGLVGESHLKCARSRAPGHETAVPLPSYTVPPEPASSPPPAVTNSTRPPGL